MISILIVTYNRAAYIAQAIDSVLIQTYPDWELIIVDGGSTDNTPAIVARYAEHDARIKYIRQAQKGGVSHDRNVGLRTAQGRYIAILDSDDIWASQDKLAEQLEFFRTHPDHVLVGSGVLEIDTAGRTLARYKNPITDTHIRRAMLFRNPFAHSSVMFLRTAALEIGGYDEVRTIGEDYDLILRLGGKGRMANLPALFLKYRVHPGSVCVMDKMTGAIETKKIVQLYRHMYPFYHLAIAKCHIRSLYTAIIVALEKISGHTV